MPLTLKRVASITPKPLTRLSQVAPFAGAWIETWWPTVMRWLTLQTAWPLTTISTTAGYFFCGFGCHLPPIFTKGAGLVFLPARQLLNRLLQLVHIPSLLRRIWISFLLQAGQIARLTAFGRHLPSICTKGASTVFLLARQLFSFLPQAVHNPSLLLLVWISFLLHPVQIAIFLVFFTCPTSISAFGLSCSYIRWLQLAHLINRCVPA